MAMPAPTPPVSRRVFISYSRDDEAFTERLETRLRAEGYVVRRDHRVLDVGDDWWRQLQAEVKAVRHLPLEG